MTRAYSRYYLDFLLAMIGKEFKVRYKQALFGFLWVFLNPLLQMAIIGAVFSLFINIPLYPIYLFTGLLLWQFISLSLTKATPSFVYERQLLQKSYFPRESIPLSIVGANFIHTLIGFFVAILFLNLLSLPPFHLGFIMIGLLWLFIFTAAISVLCATLNVFFRDTNFFIQSLVILWFYATPIVYSLDMVPSKWLVIFYTNPIVAPFDLVRYGFTQTSSLGLEGYAINALITLAVIALSLIVFNHKSNQIVDWL
jgi:lipopolysaccharide transport system permease protein